MTARAILFDLGDTLFRLDPLPADLDSRAANRLAAMGCGSADRLRPTCAAALAGIRDKVANAFARGGLEEHDIASLARLHFRDAGMSLAAGAATAVAAVLGEADVERFVPPAGLAARVRAFQEVGYRLAAVSNTTTSPELLDGYLERIGLRDLFDAAVYSSAIGVRKPHPLVYRRALAALDVEPQHAVFVGDRVREDVVGPQAVGIRAVLTHEFRREDPGAAAPLAVIPALDQLGAVLERLP